MPLARLNAADLDAAGRAYPRPQLCRPSWYSLNGEWDFAIDPAGTWQHPAECAWTHQIRVPFSPETAASGIGDTGFYRACWYRRTIELATPPDGARWLLHFGAVDYEATV